METVGRTRRRRPYTAAEKARVVADVTGLGTRGAGRRHAVPESTVRGWVKAAKAAAEAVGGEATSAAAGEPGNPTRPGSQAPASTRPGSSKGVARRYTPSEKAQILEYAADHGVTATAKHFGTSRFLDDDSRFVVGHGIDEAERVPPVLETFEQAVTRHGKPEMVLHDKGSAFWSWRGISRFTALLTEPGTDQIPAEHKEWNGKLE